MQEPTCTLQIISSVWHQIPHSPLVYVVSKQFLIEGTEIQGSPVGEILRALVNQRSKEWLRSNVVFHPKLEGTGVLEALGKLAVARKEVRSLVVVGFDLVVGRVKFRMEGGVVRFELVVEIVAPVQELESPSRSRPIFLMEYNMAGT